MTKKQKELGLLISFLVEKKVKVYRFGIQDREPIMEGTVVRFTGTYLILKSVTLSSGKWHDEFMCHSGIIGAIVEIRKDNKRVF
jgi:hypothetical protein